MRIVWASHSLVAERQWWFVNYVAMHQPDIKILKLAPRDWTGHHVDWGYPVLSPFLPPKSDESLFPKSDWNYASNLDLADMFTFTFPQEALKAVEEFKPDLIYLQNEAYCRVSQQLQRLAKRLGCKFVLFTWENLQSYDRLPEEVRHILSSSDLVICGSHDAERLVKEYNENTEVIIQVGVNTFTFAPRDSLSKDYDLIFQGRMTPEKGIETLKRAVEGQPWKILWPDPDRKESYDKLPMRYCRARVHVGHSIDTPTWHEQHGSYSNYEAISCGLYVATSHSSGIIQSLQGCPGVLFAEQNNASELRDIISGLLSQDEINLEGREWIEKQYGYKKIADRHLSAFERVMLQ